MMSSKSLDEIEQMRELAQLVADVTGNRKLDRLDAPDLTELVDALKRLKSMQEVQRTEAETIHLRNHHLENILRSMSGLVIVINLKGEIVMVNREVQVRSGYSQAELVGKNISDLLADPDIIQDKRAQPAFEPNKEYQLECRCKSGESFPVAFTVAPMQRHPGELPTLVCVAHDLTEIQDAEIKLRESEYMFRNLVETMMDGVLMVDLQDKIVYCNRRFCKMTGFSEDELKGRSAADLLVQEEDRRAMHDRAQQRNRRKSEIYDLRISRKDGSWFWATISASPITDAKGRVIGSIGIHSDISFRKVAEEELQSSLNEKEMLLKEVHHRVKNNLQVVSSLLSLQMHNVDNPRAEEILRDSQNRIKSMAAIHEKLYQSNNLARIDYADYCSQILYQLAISFGVTARNVTIDSQIRDVVLGVDVAVPCGLILNELVSNSIKYAFDDQKGGQVKITFFKDTPETYFMAVEDDGVGLPEDIDIFDTPTLGLQLVTTLVDQLDGEVKLIRENGTRFEIRFKAEEE